MPGSARLSAPRVSADQLAKLADLKEDGVLTDAEFQAQKPKVLSGRVLVHTCCECLDELTTHTVSVPRAWLQEQGDDPRGAFFPTSPDRCR